MAVSLVSTGVQFPDSTIQTTAASGSSWVYLSSVTANNSATIDVENAFDSTYSTYVIIVSDFAATTSNININVRLKINGTYATSGYRYQLTDTQSTNGTTYSGSGGGGQGQGVIGRYVYGNSDVAYGGQITMFIPAPSNTATYKTVYGTLAYYDNQPAMINGNFALGTSVTTATLTGVRFFMSGGFNIYKGTFRLYGIKAS